MRLPRAATGPLTTAALSLVVLSGLTGLSGCGVSEASVRPGVAATVDGTTIDLADVDELTGAVCAFFADTPPDGFTPYPRALQRQNGVVTKVERVALEALLDERDLELPDAYAEQVATLEAQYADEDPAYRDALIELGGDNTFVSAAASAVGDDVIEAEGRTSGSPDESIQRGLAEASGWLSEHDVDVNPVLGVEFTDEGPVQGVGDVSIPVSDAARAGQLDLQDPDVTQRIGELVATLPDDQVCGA